MEEEDLEEMKYLREISKRYEALEERQTVGYKFDLNINNKKSSIPKLPGLKHKVIQVKQDDNTEENEEMSKVMGFSGFGRVKQRNNEKTARKFDLDKMLAETKSKWKPVENQDDESSNSNLEMKNEQKTNTKHEQHDSESDEDDAIGPPLPPGFGQESKEEDEDEDEDELIGPPLPPGFSKDEEDDDFDDDEDEEQDTGSRYDVLPVNYEIELIHGSKSVTALAIDPNGSRVVSGGVDYEMRFWDFQGMDSSLQSFRAISPCESHPIKNLEFSSNGDVILVISGACVAKIVDRDGFVKGETVKGDQYITDMAHTKGHVAMLNDGIWHPRDKETFITCSNDGTCRVWSVDSLRQHISLIKPRSSGGLKAIPNSCRYTRDTQTITLGCNDGSIQMWDTRRGFVNSSAIIRDAHQKATEITCIQYSYDGTNLLSRGTDETLKLWDMKMTKKPLFVKNDLFNRFSMTDCFFSPDDNLVATGTSCRKGETSGKIMFFAKNNFELKYEMKATEGGIIRSSWHPKLNQIVVGATNGIVKVYYDPERSERGAKLCVVKNKRKYRESYEIIQPQIITPHALPLFKAERKKSWRVQMMKARKDPVKSRRPDLPVTGPGQGGRLASAGNTFASFIARNLGVKSKPDDIDPREALLRHAKEAAENPYWVSPAYSATQPKPIFAEIPKDDDDGEPSEKRPHVPV